MKPYDAEAKCPKCGCEKVSSYWQEASEYKRYSGDESPRREHIMRKCERCRYQWYERPLEGEPTSPDVLRQEREG